MSIKTKIIGFLIFLSGTALGQFTMEGYLGNAISDNELDYLYSIQGFLDENDFGSPLLREIEFRARAQNFNNGFEDYRLRFSPLNPLERKANKEYKEALTNQFNVEYQLKLEEILLNRYSLLIEHHQQSLRKHTLQESAEVYRQILDIYRQNPDQLSMKDYVSTDKSNLEVLLKLESVNTKLRTIEYTIKLTYPYTEQIKWTEHPMISVKEIKEWYNTTTINTLDNNLYLENERQKGRVTNSEFKVEKREDFRNLGYLQAEYREDQNNNFVDNLGMQVAIRLPIINPDKPDLERERLEMLEESKKMEQKQFELESYLKEAYINLDNLIKQYDIVSQKLINYQGENTVFSFSKDALDTYKEIHDFKSELEILEQNLAADIRNSYISLLSLNGQLSTPPYINYLSPLKTSYEMKKND